MTRLPSHARAFGTIVYAGLAVGVLDALDALIFFGIRKWCEADSHLSVHLEWAARSHFLQWRTKDGPAWRVLAFSDRIHHGDRVLLRQPHAPDTDPACSDLGKLMMLCQLRYIALLVQSRKTEGGSELGSMGAKLWPGAGNSMEPGWSPA
jgi:hypothetical protein